MIRRGAVYRADFQDGGMHPVIVVSREEFNRGRYLLVVVCTSMRFALRRTLPNCVPFSGGQFGFVMDCVAQCENLLSIEKGQIDLDAGPIGCLDDTHLREIIRAVGHVLEANCEPA